MAIELRGLSILFMAIELRGLSISRDRVLMTAEIMGYALLSTGIAWFVLSYFVDVSSLFSGASKPPVRMEYEIMFLVFVLSVYMGFVNQIPGITPLSGILKAFIIAVPAMLAGSLIGLYFGQGPFVGLVLLPIAGLLAWAKNAVDFIFVLAGLLVVQIMRYIPGLAQHWKIIAGFYAVSLPLFLVWNYLFDRVAFDEAFDPPEVPKKIRVSTALTAILSLTVGLIFVAFVQPYYDHTHLFWINMTVIFLLMGSSGELIKYTKARIASVFAAAIILIPLISFLGYLRLPSIFAVFIVLTAVYILFLDQVFWKYFFIHTWVITMINMSQIIMHPPGEFNVQTDLIFLRVGFTVLGGIALLSEPQQPSVF